MKADAAEGFYILIFLFIIRCAFGFSLRIFVYPISQHCIGDGIEVTEKALRHSGSVFAHFYINAIEIVVGHFFNQLFNQFHFFEHHFSKHVLDGGNCFLSRGELFNGERHMVPVAEDLVEQRLHFWNPFAFLAHLVVLVDILVHPFDCFFFAFFYPSANHRIIGFDCILA